MFDTTPTPRGDRDSSWLVLRRGLTIVRRLMRGPATKAELLAAVRTDVGPDAYSAKPSAAERALKNDRAVLKRHLGIETSFNRSMGVYQLGSLGDTPWLDLGDDELAAIGTLYNAFEGDSPEAARVRKFLDLLVGMLPEDRLSVIQRRRRILSIELRELDERLLRLEQLLLAYPEGLHRGTGASKSRSSRMGASSGGRRWPSRRRCCPGSGGVGMWKWWSRKRCVGRWWGRRGGWPKSTVGRSTGVARPAMIRWIKLLPVTVEGDR